MGNTLNSAEKPVFAATPTQTVVDLQAGADYTAKFANIRVGTNANRTALSGGQLTAGLHFYETDTDSEYVYDGGWKLWNMSWRAYTPTTSNISGSPTIDARYCVSSGLVRVTIDVTLAGANIGTAPNFSLPVAARARAGLAPIGRALYFDTSASSRQDGVVVLANGLSTAVPLLAVVSGTTILANNNVIATTPFTWAVGDIMGIDLSYEAA